MDLAAVTQITYAKQLHLPLSLILPLAAPLQSTDLQLPTCREVSSGYSSICMTQQAFITRCIAYYLEETSGSTSKILKTSCGLLHVQEARCWLLQ